MTLSKNLLAGGTITALSCLLFISDLSGVNNVRNVAGLRAAAELKNVIYDQHQPNKISSSLLSTQPTAITNPGLSLVSVPAIEWQLVDYSARQMSARKLSQPTQELLPNELTAQINIQNTFYFPELDQTGLSRTELEQASRADIATTSPATTPSIFPEAYSPEARKLMKLDDDTQTFPPLKTTGQTGFAQQTQDPSPTAVVYHF